MEFRLPCEARKQVLSSLHPLVSKMTTGFNLKIIKKVFMELVEGANDAVLGELHKYNRIYRLSVFTNESPILCKKYVPSMKSSSLSEESRFVLEICL